MIRDAYLKVLFVGNSMDARDMKRLYDANIHALLDLAIEEPRAQLGIEFVYCRVPLHDGDGNRDSMIALAIRTTLSLIRTKKTNLGRMQCRL